MMTTEGNIERSLKAPPDLKMAKHKADQLTWLYSAPPIPVMEIAEMEGIHVVFATFGDYNDKIAGYCDFKNSKLYVNADDHPRRQLFTVAHELGHWIMHQNIFSDNPDKYPMLLRFSKPSSSPREREADTFAAHLLIPDRLLKPLTPPIEGTVALLADIFLVSVTMMEIRLRGGYDYRSTFLGRRNSRHLCQ